MFCSENIFFMEEARCLYYQKEIWPNVGTDKQEQTRVPKGGNFSASHTLTNRYSVPRGTQWLIIERYLTTGNCRRISPIDGASLREG